MKETLKKFDFLGHRKIYYIFCIVLIIVSIGVGMIRGYNLGIDFTGGTMIEIEMGEQIDLGRVEDVLSETEIDGAVTYAGEGNTGIIIKTTDSLDNDQRATLLDAVKTEFSIDDEAVTSVSNIGPSVGNLLKKNAAKAIAISVVLMLIYIAVRFQWKYGLAAILALANTLLIVFGFYGLFHITINSPFIAAMLTILGYGINDTIVIFDRIRENTGGAAKKNITALAPLVNAGIHQTLGRSIMTSLTTVIVMIPLLIICGSTIRSFILPLLVGVIASTLSSIFIATSLWYDINRITEKRSYNGKSSKPAKKKVSKEPTV